MAPERRYLWFAMPRYGGSARRMSRVAAWSGTHYGGLPAAQADDREGHSPAI